MRRLEVPYFTGEDPNGWIHRVERYFDINHILEEEKVLAASICLEGKALNWFQLVLRVEERSLLLTKGKDGLNGRVGPFINRPTLNTRWTGLNDRRERNEVGREQRRGAGLGGNTVGCMDEQGGPSGGVNHIEGMGGKLEYLEHIIFAEGIRADPNKVKAMVDWPLPKDIKGIRGFLGLIGYHTSFQWGEEAMKAFQELKEMMTQLPFLSMLNSQLSFEMETDASGVGIGLVLMQLGRPLAFISHALSKRARQKSVYERELMAIVFAGQKWKKYLLGNHFIITTDQRSLKYLFEQRVLDGDQ
ncbi:Retrovirus-related Pol polyprotein, partial [Mucuna pruriens]